MDLDTLKQILDLVREHELAEFEVEQDGLRLKVRKDSLGNLVAVPAPAPVVAQVALPGAATAPQAPAAAVPVDTDLAVMKSPIVGTFYRSSEPGAAPFADVGTVVRKGQVLCIVEAMKLMNEIESEYDGEIVQVFVENGQAVQYGERLFAIRTK